MACAACRRVRLRATKGCQRPKAGQDHRVSRRLKVRPDPSKAWRHAKAGQDHSKAWHRLKASQDRSKVWHRLEADQDRSKV